MSTYELYQSILKKEGMMITKAKKVHFDTIRAKSNKKRRFHSSSRRKRALYLKDFVLDNSKKPVSTTRPEPEEYEVEAILDHKQNKGVYFYLLKWKGYSEEENSWEPSSNMFCTGLLNEYRLAHNLISPSSDPGYVSSSVSSSGTEEVSVSHHPSSKLPTSQHSSSKLPTSQHSSSESETSTSPRSSRPHSNSKPDASASMQSKASASQRSSSKSETSASQHSSSKSETSASSKSETSASSKSETLSSKSEFHSTMKNPSNGAYRKATHNSKKIGSVNTLSNGIVSSKEKSHYVDYESGRGETWCVHVRAMRTRKVLKKNRSKVKKLIISIPLKDGIQVMQSNVVSSSVGDDHNELPTGQATNNLMENAHRIFCLTHDHTYSQLRMEEIVRPISKTLLTPPPSAEPCEDISFTGPSELPLSSVFSVQISPPLSPSSPPNASSPSPQPSSPDHFCAMENERLDSDSCSQQLTDDCAPSSPILSSPFLSNDWYKLHLSSASSVSDLDVCGSDDATEVSSCDDFKPVENTCNLSEKLQSVLTYSRRRMSSHNRLRVHSKNGINGSLFSRWRKGPAPLPRSFSKRHSGASPLQTKAAKMQYSECVLSEFHDTQMNGLAPLHTPKKKLSLSLKGRSLSFDRVRTTKLEKVLALSIPNNENQLKQESAEPVELPDVLHQFEHTSVCAYKEQLMNWQYELNKQRDGTDDIIYVVNELDMIPPPSDFNYICSNVYAEGVPSPNHPDLCNSLCGCECYYLGRKCGPKSEYCCAHMAGFKFAYTPAGKVKVPPGTPIYECNAKCTCPSDCSNRIVQLGRKIPLCIFRTEGRGWGVKTTEPIKPNTFVTEYVGEVITNEEAERRGKMCDAQGITYLFDLDFEDENSAFTIDAAKYGNISHFFNHSCDPNLMVYSVWIDTLDKRLPRLAFFTTRNISVGEELTFDYQMNCNCEYSGSSGRRMPCLCGAKNCLGYIN